MSTPTFHPGLSMRLLLTTLLVAALASCTSVTAPHLAGRINVQSDVQFIQDGGVLEPVNGVCLLKRRPFSIRYMGQSLCPSVFASTNPGLRQQYEQFRAPLVTLGGTGTAVHPSDLLISTDLLQVYDGWSDAFEREWVSIGEETRIAYSTLREELPAQPILVMTGRNYTNFARQSDGSRIYSVSSINGEDVSEFRSGSFSVILFADFAPPGTSAMVLLWAPLEVVFVDG